MASRSHPAAPAVSPPLPAPELWPAEPLDALSRPAGAVVFAAPVVAVAALAYAGGYRSGVHERLVDQTRGAFEAGGGETLAGLYPPLPALAALPGGAFGLGLLAGALGGLALWVIWRRLCRVGAPWWLRTLLVVAVGMSPPFLYYATQSLPNIAGALLLAVVIEGYVRFAAARDTAGGFSAGLLLGLAFYCTPYTTVYAVALALASPAVCRRLGMRAPGATRATATVILFPVVAAFCGWIFMEWVVSGSVFNTLRGSGAGEAWFGVSRERAGTEAFSALAGDLLRVPLFVAVALLAARRSVVYPLALAVVPVLSLSTLAFSPPAADAVTYLTLALLAGVLVPGSLDRLDRRVLAAVAAAQLAVTWLWPGTPEAWAEAIRAAL